MRTATVMAADSKQNMKTLRVDNWAVFFLQRLQLMFAKGDCCDLTLKFHTGQELKVHRLVLITCTNFFENMEKEGNVITMPESLPYSVVQPIINFLYSGKLEFKSELHPQLLAISKNLNITILAKLLVTQKNENGLGAAFVKPNDSKKPQRTFLATRIGPAPSGGLGGRKLPIWRQRTFPLYRPNTTRVIKDEEPKPMRFEWPEGKEPTDSLLLTSPSFTPLSYESEPVFTPANPPVFNSSPQDNSSSQNRNIHLKRRASSPHALPEKLFKEDQRDGPVEIKKECTSEAGGDFSDDDDGHFETIHTYGDSDDEQELTESGEHSQPVIRPPITSNSLMPQTVAPEPTIQTYRPVFKSQQPMNQPVTPAPQSSKAADPPAFDPIAESTPAIQTSIIPSSQTPKPILKATDPHSAQTPTKKVRFSIAEENQNSQEVTKQSPKGISGVSPPSEVIYEAQPSLPSLPTSNLHATPLSNIAQCSKAEIITPEVMPSPIPVHTSPTPILPLQISATIPPMSKPTTVQTYSKSSTYKTEKRTISPADSANHAKIIAEVLKKYPDLVKNNKNIRLKISAPGSSNITNTLTLDTKKSAGKAYVVVKSSVKTETPSPTKLETPSPSNAMAKPAVLAQPTQQSTLNGPWQCIPCGKDGVAIEFSSYFDYRKHVQDVHEKVDSRTCEYCGYKTSKRNLYLYHLFTKHNVTPPKSIIFPKCDECGYVALSEGLLQKHTATHKAAVKDWPCPRCEITFRSYNSLQVHLQSCSKPNQKENHICPFCNQSFESTFILNSHVKVCGTANSVPSTKDTSHSENLASHIYDGTGPRPEQAVEMIEVPIMNADALRGKGEHTYVQLPSGLILTDASNVALLPTSEGEELNATNSMSGPIGLTVALPQDQHVILLDANSEFFIQGNDQVVVTRMNNTDEYIVPEVLDESMQQIYSTHALPYSVATTSGNMIACPVVPMQSTSHPQPMDKPEDSGNTVVRVQDHVDPNEIENMQIQHHVSASDIESIIVHEGTSTDDLGQQRQVSSDHVDIYVEESESQPPRHHMSINKELMDVVAMEVQRSPMIEHGSMTMALPEPLTPQHQTVLRRPDATCEREVVVSAASSYGSIAPTVIQEQGSPSSPVSQDADDLNANGVVSDTVPRTSDDASEVHQVSSGKNVETHAQNAAKADSLVRDWGFDNEEENDTGEAVEIDDSDSDDGSQTGPSRVTVEL